MSDPNAQYDHTVLDLIEHSPIGAVPMTPVYQDALGRLYATHQVYASADHPNGHVTARSLATRPNFHARNLEALIAGEIEVAALESNSGIFDRYLQSVPASLRPKAESLRVAVAGRPAHHRVKHLAEAKAVAIHDPVHTLFLVPGAGPHPGLPGNYLFGSLLETGSAQTDQAWAVQLHDRDDGAASFAAPSLAAALEKLSEVLASAPFTLDELKALGFRMV
jgi:hypothetical protein